MATIVEEGRRRLIAHVECSGTAAVERERGGCSASAALRFISRRRVLVTQRTWPEIQSPGNCDRDIPGLRECGGPQCRCPISSGVSCA